MLSWCWQRRSSQASMVSRTLSLRAQRGEMFSRSVRSSAHSAVTSLSSGGKEVGSSVPSRVVKLRENCADGDKAARASCQSAHRSPEMNGVSASRSDPPAVRRGSRREMLWVFDPDLRNRGR